eukprot:g14126.t1
MVAKDAGSSAMLRRSATTTRRAQSFLVVPVYFACATRVGASLFGPWFRNKGVREQLADLEEQTWLLILGNSVFRGLYLTLVDMILRQDQKGDLRSSALQKCWGYADFQVGNLRVTYQDMRLYEFTTVEDSVVCDDDKLSATSSAAFIASCDQFLRSTVFGNDTAGWPKVVVAPSHLVDSDESPNLAIEVVMEALPAAWKGELLFIDHMAGLGRFWKQDNPTMTALHDVNPTPPTLRGHHVREVVGERTTPTESTRDNGIGRMRAYTERDPRVHFMSAFPMYQAKLFENERTRNGMWRFGASVHYHYVLSPKEAKAQGATRMVYSTMTEMIAHVVIGKAVGKKEALYDLYSTTHHPKPRNSQIGDIFQVCTDCPESLIPHHVKPTPEPTCVVAARLLPENQTYPAWNGTLCPSWCMAEQPVDKKQTQSGFVDVRKCSLQNDPPGN